MFQTKAVKKIKTHILCSWTLFEKWCRAWDNAEERGSAGRAADDGIIWQVHFACWVTKTTNTHSQLFKTYSCSVVTVFVCILVLRYMHVDCNVFLHKNVCSKKVIFFVTDLHVICIHRTHTGKVISVGHSMSAYLSLVTTGSSLVKFDTDILPVQIVYFVVWDLRLLQVCRWRYKSCGMWHCVIGRVRRSCGLWRCHWASSCWCLEGEFFGCLTSEIFSKMLVLWHRITEGLERQHCLCLEKAETVRLTGKIYWSWNVCFIFWCSSVSYMVFSFQ